MEAAAPPALDSVPASRFDARGHQRDFVPIRGWERAPKLGLLDCVKGLSIEDIADYVADAFQFADDYLRRNGGVDPIGGLNRDQIAALNLYTRENVANTAQSFFRVLNRTCASRDRRDLLPFFSYLRLFFEAARKLPNACPAKLWRGFPNQVPNWSQVYKKGEQLYWWGFSSTTKNSDVLQNGGFFGAAGERTLFVLDCISGIDISMYSAYPEDEVLLMPGTKFQVEHTMSPKLLGGVLQVVLKQLPTSQDILNHQPPPPTDAPTTGPDGAAGVARPPALLSINQTQEVNAGTGGESPRPRFAVGDIVMWRRADADVPHGTRGRVVGYAQGNARVQFPRGTFSFKDNELQPAASGLRAPPPGEEFAVGDAVTWQGHDGDIPPGTIGLIVDYKRNSTDKLWRVRFPKGTWNFKREQLKAATSPTDRLAADALDSEKLAAARLAGPAGSGTGLNQSLLGDANAKRSSLTSTCSWFLKIVALLVYSLLILVGCAFLGIGAVKADPTLLFVGGCAGLTILLVCNAIRLCSPAARTFYGNFGVVASTEFNLWCCMSPAALDFNDGGPLGGLESFVLLIAGCTPVCACWWFMFQFCPMCGLPWDDPSCLLTPEYWGNWSTGWNYTHQDQWTWPPFVGDSRVVIRHDCAISSGLALFFLAWYFVSVAAIFVDIQRGHLGHAARLGPVWAVIAAIMAIFGGMIVVITVMPCCGDPDADKVFKGTRWGSYFLCLGSLLVVVMCVFFSAQLSNWF